MTKAVRIHVLDSPLSLCDALQQLGSCGGSYQQEDPYHLQPLTLGLLASSTLSRVAFISWNLPSLWYFVTVAGKGLRQGIYPPEMASSWTQVRQCAYSHSYNSPCALFASFPTARHIWEPKSQSETYHVSTGSENKTLAKWSSSSVRTD